MNNKMKKLFKTKKEMEKIRAIDLEVNRILRERHNREEVEEKRAANKPGKSALDKADKEPWVEDMEEESDEEDGVYL